MVSELGLTRGTEFDPSLCNLNISSPFEYLKVHNGLFLLFDSPCAQVWGRTHVREGVKNRDLHIKPKSYKLELLGELVF